MRGVAQKNKGRFRAPEKIIGGSGEIRTHGGRKSSSVFKTGALNRSATLPFFYWNLATRTRKTNLINEFNAKNVIFCASQQFLRGPSEDKWLKSNKKCAYLRRGMLIF
jgi:hypothetical protein